MENFTTQSRLAISVGVPFLLASLALAPSESRATPPAPTYKLFRLGTAVGTPVQLRSMAETLRVKFTSGDNDVQGEVLDGDVVRGYVVAGERPKLVVLPDLANAKVSKSTKDTAQKLATDFVRKFKLEAGDASKFTPLAVEPWRSQTGSEGKLGAVQDRLFSVSFARKIDSIETIGPSSIMNVQVDARGVVGVMDAVRRVDVVSTFKPKLKTLADATRERDAQIKRMSEILKGKPKILAQHIAYVDQGISFVQPAYIWGVEWQGEKGKSANLVTIPIFANTPEPIMDMSMQRDQKPPEDGKPQASIENNELYASLAPQANPVQIGMYVVRNDHSCWVDSAWGFWTNVRHGGGLPTRNLLQYWWNQNYYWQNVGSTNSMRRSVAGQVHVALLEGHGAPWEITCLRNNADFIFLKQIAGFGSLMGGGEKTAYVIWHSCDVVPVPGDAHGGDFNSGTAWDVWWHLFRGMRGTYGYRTTMAICDGVCSGFGDHVGRGCANLSSWLNETGGQWWLRFWNGWDHGSAVYIAGHENDCIYNNNGLPAPGSLSMWWN